MTNVSYFENVKHPSKKRDADLFRFLTTDYFKDTVERIRNGESELKSTLPAITPHARFEAKRGLDEPHEPTGILFVDIDGKEQTHEAQAIKEMFMQLEETYAVRLSSSGNGVHAFVYIGENSLEHSFHTMRYLMEQVGVKIDKCKDISRLCFASYDPSVYINTSPKRLELLHDDILFPKVETVEFNYEGDDPQHDFYNYCKRYETDFAEGGRNHWIYHKAQQGREKFGLSQLQVEATLMAWVCKGFSRHEIETTVRSAFK